MFSTSIPYKLNYERLNVHYAYWLKTHRFGSDMRNRFTASGNAQILISTLLRHSASMEFHCSTGYRDERAPNWKRNDRKLRPELRGYIVSFRAAVLLHLIHRFEVDVCHLTLFPSFGQNIIVFYVWNSSFVYFKEKNSARRTPCQNHRWWSSKIPMIE